MNICGYSRKKNGSHGRFTELKECSLICTLEELDELCGFFEYVREIHGKHPDEYLHSHFIDHCSSTDNILSDIIVITGLDNEKDNS